MTVKQYLEEHGITEKTAASFGLKTVTEQPFGERLVIPIKDKDGKVIFNKYRNVEHDLKKDQIPKYNNEPGSEENTFNSEVLAKKHFLVMEGEIDVIRASQDGIDALSGTSGAKTIPKTWLTDFEGKNVWLCYDNDETGQEATRKLLEQFPLARVITLPEGVKDYCEFRKDHSREEAINLIKVAKTKAEWKADNLPEKYQAMNVKELFAIEYPEENWIVDKFIPRTGFTMFVGESGAAKSYLALYLAKCLQTGEPFMDHFEVKETCPVLIIDKENGLRRIQARLRGLETPDTANIYMLKYPEFFRLDDEEFMEAVQTLIVSNGIRVVVLDSFVDVVLGSENDAGDTSRVFDALRSITSINTEVAWVPIHHDSKPMPRSNRTSGQKTRGSSNILAQIDNQFYLEKTKQLGIIHIEQGKARDEEPVKKFAVQLVADPDTKMIKTFRWLNEVTGEADRVDEATDWVVDWVTSKVGISREDLLLDGNAQDFQGRTLERAIKIAEEKKLIILQRKPGAGLKKFCYPYQPQGDDELADEALDTFAPD